MTKKFDKVLILLSVFYIVFPIILFVFGWLKLPLAIVVSIPIIFMSFRVFKQISACEEISITVNPRFWVIALLTIAVWVLFSGIGNFSFQTGDFIVRNPMFRDLERYSWPVLFDLSEQPDIVKQFTGNNDSALYVYYFAWWLPAAFLARCMFFVGFMPSNVEIYAQIALYIWAVLGLFLTFYCLVRYLKKYSYWILSAFVLFGGLDIIPYFIINTRLPRYEHIEWWAGGICAFFQYSANTTQLYWVFNQSIPVWLIVAVLLLMKQNSSKAAWSSLCIAYSPYATIGMIPIAVYSILKKDDQKLSKRIMSAVSFENISVVVVMAITFVSFYFLEMKAGTASGGFLFSQHREFRTFTIYVAFVIVEFLIYFIIMGKTARKYEYYWVVLIELFILPLFKSGMNNDFTMRASIPALFILMVLCLQYVFEMHDKNLVKNRNIMLICLCLGYLVSYTEIQRNVAMTLTVSQHDYIIEDVYSFGHMFTDSEYQIQVNINQYMSLEEDYKGSFFYKYLMKKK